MDFKCNHKINDESNMGLVREEYGGNPHMYGQAPSELRNACCGCSGRVLPSLLEEARKKGTGWFAALGEGGAGQNADIVSGRDDDPDQDGSVLEVLSFLFPK